MAKVLVIRLSALGDVAISVPLVKALAEQFPEHEFIMVSQSQMAGLYAGCPPNVRFFPADIRGRHKGVIGLFRLFREIYPVRIDVVCDVHDVLRSRILRSFFGCCRVPVFRINKQRAERRRLVRKNHKELHPLKTSFQRYRDVFAKAGLSLNYFDLHPRMGPEKEQLPMMERRFGVKNTKWVGFAPFARHKGKIYPLEKSEIVLAELCADRRITVFVFGGGKEERAQINVWKKKFPEIVLPEKMSLQEEVELMSCLDVVLTMDSANMHLASLAHANVLSIWGATHPYAGFYGLFQSERNAIQTSLSCRPCSIYGNKPCYRGDYACMHNIDPMTIVEKIKTEISLL